jgi:hypothetical protein
MIPYEVGFLSVGDPASQVITKEESDFGRREREDGQDVCLLHSSFGGWQKKMCCREEKSDVRG